MDLLHENWQNVEYFFNFPVSWKSKSWWKVLEWQSVNFTSVYNTPSNKRMLTRRGSSVKADLYSTRSRARMSNMTSSRCSWPHFKWRCTWHFFFTFHAALLPKMHDFRATLAKHCTSVQAFVWNRSSWMWSSNSILLMLWGKTINSFFA